MEVDLRDVARALGEKELELIALRQKVARLEARLGELEYGPDPA